jgi:hypothetical protein
LRRQAARALEALARDSQEFARLMRQWIPRVHVFPVRLCNGGRPEPRAVLTFDLTPILPASAGRESLGRVLQAERVIDLFEAPDREGHRTEVVQRTAGGMKQRQIAEELGLDLATVQRAVELQRAMDRLGLTDPYLPITSPPPEDGRWRRHRHPRYRFEPLPGYPLPVLGR